jgi:hypothetical protein
MKRGYLWRSVRALILTAGTLGLRQGPSTMADYKNDETQSPQTLDSRCKPKDEKKKLSRSKRKYAS